MVPITHLHTKLACYLAVQNRTFQRYSIPYDLYHLLNINQRGKYLPLLHVDGLSTLERHMVVRNILFWESKYLNLLY